MSIGYYAAHYEEDTGVAGGPSTNITSTYPDIKEIENIGWDNNLIKQSASFIIQF